MLPRFLFRGFYENSGGNKELNTSTAITPHAFLGSSMNLESNMSVESGLPRNFNHSNPMALNTMSLEDFRSEINGHLQGKTDIASHFSSWTADWGTARRYAMRGYLPGETCTRYIGIFDTSRRDHGNMILHVRALRIEGHTTCRYDYEYLVYGPVDGVAYTCMALYHRHSNSLNPPLNLPLFSEWSGWPVLWSYKPLSSLCKAYNEITRSSFYHAAGTEHEARWGSCTDTALYLTMIAAEWGKNASPDSPYWPFSTATREERFRLLISDLSQVIKCAARDATLVLPIVNPRTHQEDLPYLKKTIELLLHFEAEITRLRSKPPHQSWLWSLARFLGDGFESIRRMQMPTFWLRARRNDEKRE